MLSFQMEEKINAVFQTYENAEEFRSLIRAAGGFYHATQNNLQKILQKSGKDAENVQSFRNQLGSLRKTLEAINVRGVFGSIQKIQDALVLLDHAERDDIGMVRSVSEGVEDFSKVYEDYIKNYTAEAAINLIIAARLIEQKLSGFFIALRIFLTNLGESPEAGSKLDASVSEFSIYMPDYINLKDFAEKLMAIYELYNEISGVINSSATSIPLRVVKIESGSLWLKIFGDSKVIGLIVYFLRSGANYLYRNYTQEGRIEAIPQKLEALDAIMDFSNRLKEAGVDTVEIHENLRVSAVKIAKEVNRIIVDQREVTINGETQSLALEMQKQIGMSSPAFRLPDAASKSNYLPPPNGEDSEPKPT